MLTTMSAISPLIRHFSLLGWILYLFIPYLLLGCTDPAKSELGAMLCDGSTPQRENFRIHAFFNLYARWRLYRRIYSTRGVTLNIGFFRWLGVHLALPPHQIFKLIILVLDLISTVAYYALYIPLVITYSSRHAFTYSHTQLLLRFCTDNLWVFDDETTLLTITVQSIDDFLRLNRWFGFIGGFICVQKLPWLPFSWRCFF